MAQAGIEPATFRFVEQQLNHGTRYIEWDTPGRYSSLLNTACNFVHIVFVLMQPGLELKTTPVDNQ